MSSPYVSLLEAIRTHCNLPDFPNPLPSNQLTLELENGPSMTIDFEEATSMVVLFAEIGTYEKEQETAVLSTIVQANFLWVATSGATLSARPDIETVYLAQQFPVDSLEGDSFIKLVEEFVRITQEWKTILPALTTTNSEPLEEITAHNELTSQGAITPTIA